MKCTFFETFNSLLNLHRFDFSGPSPINIKSTSCIFNTSFTAFSNISILLVLFNLPTDINFIDFFRKIELKVFDFIHSVDTVKLAQKISNEQKKITLRPKIFIQINLGEETQKSGINYNNIKEFYKFCKSIDLDVIGTMCIPPINKEPSIYFKKMLDINNNLNIKELSMGMSSDYLLALENKSTYLRIGSKIFGKRI